MSTPEPPPYPGEAESGGQDPVESSVPSHGSVPPPPESPTPVPAGGAFSAPDAIGWGWHRFTANIGASLIAAFVVLVPAAAAYFVLGLLNSILLSGPDPTTLRSFGVCITQPGDTVLSILVSSVACVFTGVLIKAALDLADGLPFDFFGAFAKVNFGQLIATSLLVSLCVGIGLAACWLPGLVAGFCLLFALYVVVDSDVSASDAIQKSVSLVSSHLSDSLVLYLLCIVIGIAGSIPCGLGLFVAIPVTVFATAHAYRTFTGRPVAA